MNLEQIYNIIQSDEIAKNLALIGNDTDCAKRVSEITPISDVLVDAGDIKKVASMNGAWASVSLARESSQVPDQIKGICITFLNWIESGYRIDFTLNEVQSMMNGLILSGIISQDQANAISNLGKKRYLVNTNEISAAMLPYRVDGRI